MFFAFLFIFRWFMLQMKMVIHIFFVTSVNPVFHSFLPRYTVPTSSLIVPSTILELPETLLRSCSLRNLQHVKSYCFTERSAFSDSYYITDFDVSEAGTEMDAHVTVAFLEPVILSDIMQIIPSYNDSPLHLHLLDNSCKNTSSDRNIASEWTFLVNVSSFQGLTRRFEPKTDIAAISHGLLSLGAQTFLPVKKDRGLLLKRTLGL